MLKDKLAELMNQLSIERRAQILRLLTEGTSMRAASRIVDCSLNTVTKLLVDTGKACAAYQDKVLRNLPCKTIQCDEIWAFCGSKERNVPEGSKGEGRGDVWTWVALCADTKLVPCWRVGRRTEWDARFFMDDLAARLSNRVQLTTDGYHAYVEAVERSFGSDVDYARLIKTFTKRDYKEHPEVRYSSSATPPTIHKIRVKGRPEKQKISTSLVERCNLTIRMSDRRFTRLTNAFSKKLENLRASVALHMMHYNFCRIHKTLRVSPAMEAGVEDRLWTLEEVVEMKMDSNHDSIKNTDCH